MYELFQFTYTRITANVNMVQESDLDLFTKDQYGLTLHRDRLFVRYFKNLYVYSIRVKRWSRWESNRKFSKIVVIPSATVGLDTAYASSASLNRPYESYLFKDDRRTNDAGGETISVPTLVGTRDNVPGGAVTNYTQLYHASTVQNNWIYHFHVQDWTVAENDPTWPVGWTVVVPKQTAGVLGNGIQWWVMKKQVQVEVSAVINMPSAHIIRSMAVTLICPDEHTFTLGAPVAPRAGISPSVTTVPGTSVDMPVSSLALAVMFNRNTAAGLTVPPAVAPAEWVAPTVTPATVSPMQMALSSRVTLVDAAMTGNAIFTWTGTDIGQVGGIQVVIPSVVQATDTTIERFKGRIITKTYDFDVPHAYKVHFMWGISIATSGKVYGALIIPNARQNMTYQEALDKYGTFAAAIAAVQTWSSNTPVTIPDTILPSLGKYGRKYLKVLKKVRFRQILYTLDMDVITNRGIADASLRLYDLTVFLKQKETVVKTTS